MLVLGIGNWNNEWICARWWQVLEKYEEYFLDHRDEIYQFKAVQV
jgi:hypothetical protein